MSRYNNNLIATNDLDIYQDTFKKRGVTKIRQYRTKAFRNTNSDLLDYAERVWRDGDSFWKLSNKFYGNPDHWYVIARFNNTPTEAHVKVGDVIKIPINLSQALQVFS